jgi:hypothetical protein
MPADAARPLAYANQSINAGFENLRDLLTGTEKIDKGNWEQGKVNNTNNVLDALAKYKTPEALAAAQAAGEVPDTTQFGAQIDRNAVRGAEEARMGQLRTALTQQQQYDEQQNRLAHQPIFDQALAKYRAGDIAGGDALASGFPNMPQQAELMGMKRDLTRQNTQDGYAKTLHEQAIEKFGNDKTKWPLELQKLTAEVNAIPVELGIRQTQANTAAANARVAALRETNSEAERLDKLRDSRAEKTRKQVEEANEIILKNAGMSKGNHLGTDEGLKEFSTQLDKIPGLGDREKASYLATFSRLGKSGIDVGDDSQQADKPKVSGKDILAGLTNNINGANPSLVGSAEANRAGGKTKAVMMPLRVQDAIEAVVNSRSSLPDIAQALPGMDAGASAEKYLQNKLGYQAGSKQDKESIKQVATALKVLGSQQSAGFEALISKHADKNVGNPAPAVTVPEVTPLMPPAQASAYLNNKENLGRVLGTAAKQFEMRPPPQPWTPGQQLDAKAKTTWGSEAVKNTQINQLVQEWLDTKDPVWKKDLEKQIKAAGGEVPGK